LALERSFGEAGDFVILRLSNRLGLLLFHPGGNAARRPPITQPRGRKAQGCGRRGNPEGDATF